MTSYSRSAVVPAVNPETHFAAVERATIGRCPGKLPGEEVIRVMTNTRKMTADVRIWGAQNTLACPGRQRTNTGREGSPGTYQDGGPVKMRLGVLGIGDIALTTVNAEVYNLISQRLKKQSPISNTVMVTLAIDPGNGELVIFEAASRPELKRLKTSAASEATFPERDGRHVPIAVINEDSTAGGAPSSAGQPRRGHRAACLLRCDRRPPVISGR